MKLLLSSPGDCREVEEEEEEMTEKTGIRGELLMIRKVKSLSLLIVTQD